LRESCAVKPQFTHVTDGQTTDRQNSVDKQPNPRGSVRQDDNMTLQSHKHGGHDRQGTNDRLDAASNTLVYQPINHIYSHVYQLMINPLLLPYWYSYKASCTARPS